MKDRTSKIDRGGGGLESITGSMHAKISVD